MPDDAFLEPFSETPDHLTAYGDPDAFVRSVVGVVRAGSLVAALQVVRDALDRDGKATLEGLAILEVRADGERRLIAQERDLVPMVGVRSISG